MFFPSQSLCASERKQAHGPSSSLLTLFFHPHLSLFLLDMALPIPPFPFQVLHPPSHPATHPHPQHCFSSVFCIILHLLSIALFYSVSSSLHIGGLTVSAQACAAGSLDYSPHVNGTVFFFFLMNSMHCEVYLRWTTQLTREIIPLSLTDPQKGRQTKT